MKSKLFGRKGSVTLFLCIILSAAVLLETIYIEGAYRRKQEVVLTEAVSHQVEQILSQFNRDYLDWYGIYVLDDVESASSVFDEMTKNYSDMSFDYQLTDEFSSEDLRASSVEYMKLRGIAFEGSALLDRLDFSISQLAGNSHTGGFGFGNWLPTFKDYLKNKEKYSDRLADFQDICDVLGLGDKMELFSDLCDDMTETWEKSSSQFFECGDESVSLSIFDPGSIDSVASAMDSYVDADLPSVVDRLLLNEYAVFSFDSVVSKYEGDDGYEDEANIIGIPFDEIHGSNTMGDLEYLFVGSSDSTCNNLVSFGTILGIRLILDYCAYLMDDSMRSLALIMAEILCILISLLTLFTVNLSPSVVQYFILFVFAYIAAFSDVSKLLLGMTVPIFYNDSVCDTLGDFADTQYRDYFRLLLLFVPEEKLLERMHDVIVRDCGDGLYTGVEAEGTLRDDSFVVKRRFELYENPD